MAGAKKADDATENGEAAPAAPKKGKGLLIGIAVLVLAAAGGGGYFFFAKSGKPKADAEHGAAAEGAEGAAAHAANYLALDPAFVVNLNDPEAMRFLQVQVEVMTRDPKALEAVKLHTPRIRNALLMLFGQQRSQDIATREGKEALQKKVLEEIQRILKEETGNPGVEAVYFTSFVTQ